MPKKRQRQINDEEVALIKAMLKRDFAKDRIQSFFSRPDRVVNYGRIHNIKDGKLGAAVPPASDDVLDDFLARWPGGGPAEKGEFEHGPLDDAVLKKLFRLSAGKLVRVECDETDLVEFKATFQPAKFPRYAKVAASLANRRGGYLLFGVEDETRQLLGLNSDTFEKTDIGRFSQRLNAFVQPAVTCSKRIWAVNGRKLGILYIEPSPNPPVVATRDGDSICDGAIYYRYPGCSDTIKHGDLLALLNDRDRRIGAAFLRQVQKIADAGVQKVSVLNHVSGEISGPAGSLLIDEALLEKIKFVLDGHFVETGGAPALRVIGNVATVSHNSIQPVKPIKSSLSPHDILHDFIFQKEVDDPISYVRQIVHLQQIWVPIFFYIHLANISVEQAITELLGQPTSRLKSRASLIKRIQNRTKIPVKRGHTTENYRSQIDIGLPIEFTDIKGAKERSYAVRSLRTLTEKEVDFEVCFETLRRAWTANVSNQNAIFLNEIRYAATHIDVIVFGNRVDQPNRSQSFPNLPS